jgi:hypothetical protein
VKIYGAEAGSETRYSPAVCLGCKTETVSGDPDPNHISTSYVERQNLTMRMSMRRFTRLTNAFSKNGESRRSRGTLLHVLQLRAGPPDAPRHPAMEAGVSDHVWSIEEIARLLEGR